MTHLYKCSDPDCLDEFEVWEGINDVQEYCHTCGKRTAALMIAQSHGDGFMLKGSGWSGGRGSSAAIKMHMKADEMPLSRGGRND